VYPFRYDISLRITHPTMHPQQICDRLGLKAQRMWKAGQNRATPTGTPLSGVYKETYCTFDLARSREDELERFIKHSNKIFQRHKRFLRHISSTGGSIEYFVGMYLDKNHGVMLSPELLDELAKLQIALALDLYGGSDRRRRKLPRRT
jgi:hypothetical protein